MVTQNAGANDFLTTFKKHDEVSRIMDGHKKNPIMSMARSQESLRSAKEEK